MKIWEKGVLGSRVRKNTDLEVGLAQVFQDQQGGHCGWSWCKVVGLGSIWKMEQTVCQRVGCGTCDLSSGLFTVLW